MNLGTIFVLLIVAAIAAGIIFKIIRDKKKGKSACGCDCSSCGGACHCNNKPQNNQY